MSSKLFDIYSKQLNLLFEKIAKIIETLPSFPEDKFSFQFNELEITFKDSEKKFQQMDFELLTMRSPIQKETLSQTMVHLKESYEKYKDMAYLLKEKGNKQPVTVTSKEKTDQPQVSNEKNIIQTNQSKISQPQAPLHKPKEIKEPSWLAQDNNNNQIYRRGEISNLESYRISINEDSSLGSSVVFQEKRGDEGGNMKNEKYSKNKLGRLYRGKLLLTQLSQKYPKMFKYGVASMIVLIIVLFAIYSHSLNSSDRHHQNILRPEEIISKFPSNNSTK